MARITPPLRLFDLKTHEELSPNSVHKLAHEVGNSVLVFREPQDGGMWHECPSDFAANFPHISVRKAYLSPVALGPPADQESP